MLQILTAIITAFLIDISLGDPPNRFHPVVLMGSFIRFGTQKLNQGSKSMRFLKGMALILAGGALFSLPWLLLLHPFRNLPFWAAGIILGLLLKPVFAFRGLLKAGREVEQALLENNLVKARRLTAWHLVSRDTSTLETGEITSAVIESLAENLTDSFLAPLLFFSIGGLPLAWAYRFVNTADAMIGYHNPEFEYFGKFAARLDDLLNWLPARLGGVLLAAAAGLCRLNLRSAFSTMFSQHHLTSSPNAGWTMAAAAGALEIRLEKKGHYALEGGKAFPVAQDIQRAMRLVKTTLILYLFLNGGIILAGTIF